jgi:stage II sporulation protein D
MKEKYQTDIGEITKLEIRSRTRSGRVGELVVSGTESSRLVVGSDRVRAILGAPSSLLDPDILTVGPTEGAFRISGRGQGSGVGLSQHGALGMAVDEAEYDEILGHYYRGVSLAEDLGRGGSRRLSLGIDDSTLDGSLGGHVIAVDLSYRQHSPASVAISGSGIWTAGQQSGVFEGEVQAEARGDQVLLVSAETRQALADTAEVSPSRDGGYLRLSAMGGEQRPLSYRGSLLLRAQGGRLRVINKVAFEDYVRGVVSNEVFSLGGAEMFKVQAVISRTFALYEQRFGHDHPDGIDVCATGLHCQEYRGQATETSWGDDAVKATAGEVLTYRGEPIRAYYHDNGGGCTELPDLAGWANRASEFPYIASVQSPDDEAGRLLEGFEWCYEWGPEQDAVIRGHYGDRTVLDPWEIAERLLAICGVDVGEVLELTIEERTRSQRVSALEIRGSLRTYIVRGTDDDVRKVLRTPSALITSIAEDGGLFKATGRGRAHGVGLSQQGAMGRAIRCERYEDILQYYYRDVELTPSYGEGHRLSARPE